MNVEIIGDGRIFTGVDMKAVATEMKRQDFSCPATIRQYMETVARRVKAMTGQEVRTDQKVKAFLEDLEKLGLIKICER
jgi:hypothetical protein